MLDLDVLNVLVHKNDEDLISTICKARQEINVLKAYVDGDGGRWSELQVNKLLNSAFGADDVKRLTAQTAGLDREAGAAKGELRQLGRKSDSLKGGFPLRVCTCASGGDQRNGCRLVENNRRRWHACGSFQVGAAPRVPVHCLGAEDP